MLAGVAFLAPRSPAGETVSFRPVAGGSGCVGAFLVAGPFEKPLASLETPEPVKPAREGGPVPGAPDRSWRLVLAPAHGRAVALGEPGDSGYLYAQVALPLAENGKRYAVFAASCDIAVWTSGGGGRPRRQDVRAYENGQTGLAPGKGLATLVLRVALDGSPATVYLAYGSVSAGGGISPSPTALTLADASGERLAGLVAEALAVRLFPALVREGDRVLAELSAARALPDVDEKFSVRFLARPEGALVEVEQRAGPIEDFSAPKLASASFRVPKDSPGRFRIEAELSRNGRPFARVSATGLVAEGIEKSFGKIEERARSLVGVADVPQSAVAYALLQAAKARLGLERAGGILNSESVVEEIAGAEKALAGAREGRDFQAGRTGFMERAYFSEVDESPQPYLVYIPTGCRKGTGPWPLVVYYHGYVPDYDIDNWLGEYPRLNAVMEAEGCILAVPFARSNTDFLTVGEDDCLRVVDEMKKLYPVDPKRVYLYGYSMGGLGVWTTLCHYPDRFAAATIISGQADMYLWHRVPRERYEPWKRFLIDCDNPVGLVGNIAHVPVRVYHGAADFVVSPDHSRRMVNGMKALGADAELTLVTPGSHWSLYDSVLFKREPTAWMKRFSIPDDPPAKFVLKSHHPRYAGAWGLEVTGLRRWMEPAEVSVERDGDRVTVEARNVSALSIRAPLFRKGTEFVLRPADGGEYVCTEGPEGLHASLRGADRPTSLQKRSGLCGPVKEALRFPFVVVYGTGGDAREREELRAAGERFAREWREFAKGLPPVRSDRQVTPELARSKNLVLLGEPETNSVLRSIAGELPVKWDRLRAEVAGRRVELANPDTGSARGLLFCYPNPRAPGRLVVVMSGLFWGEALSVNHKLDRVPDLILYEDEKDTLNPNDPHNKAVVAGFFGPDWRVETGRFFVDDAAPGVEPVK